MIFADVLRGNPLETRQRMFCPDRRNHTLLTQGLRSELPVSYTHLDVYKRQILDHRGIVVSDPVGALAHLQLGRAYALSGETMKAKAAYQDFLTLWKDADPDIPVLKEAKAEYAKLQ